MKTSTDRFRQPGFSRRVFPSRCCADPPKEVMNITRPDDVKFVTSPIVPGAANAVLSGDPKVPGQIYVVRNRFSPGTFSPPHFHPETRYILVLKGTWWVGSGPDLGQEQDHAGARGQLRGAPPEPDPLGRRQGRGSDRADHGHRPGHHHPGRRVGKTQKSEQPPNPSATRMSTRLGAPLANASRSAGAMSCGSVTRRAARPKDSASDTKSMSGSRRSMPVKRSVLRKDDQALLDDAVAAVVRHDVGDRQPLVRGGPQALDAVHRAAVAHHRRDRPPGQRHADADRAGNGEAQTAAREAVVVPAVRGSAETSAGCKC